MMWTLVVVWVAGGSSAATAPNLASCQQQFELSRPSEVKDAYCVTAMGDRVYLVKDGVSFRWWK